MSIDGVACRRKTEDLIDEWAHDAGIVGKDEHVKARAGLESSDAAWKGRNHVTAGEVGEAVAHAVVEVGPEVAEHALLSGHGATALRATTMGSMPGEAFGAGLVGTATAVGAFLLYKGAWADAHAKGDGIRELQHNDAVNVALAEKLAFAPGFAANERALRPGVEKGTSQLEAQLDGKDKALVPILQARADEGFIAQKRAYEATKSLAGKPERAEAMQKWMKDNGFADRQRNDVAFGKGAEYFVWLKGVPVSAGGIELTKTEIDKVETRMQPANAFVCRG